MNTTTRVEKHCIIFYQYGSREDDIPSTGGTFTSTEIGSISTSRTPDLSPSFAVLSQVLEVISNALRIRMVMKNAEGKKIGFGKGFNRHLCCRISVADEEASYSFSSPVLDNLGRDLINRLVAIKAQIPNTGLNVQESRWCGMQKSGEKAMEATRSSSPPQWATKEIANLRISAAKLKHVEKWSPQALYTFDIERIFPLMISHREHSSACF
ncbi:hypothetical protein HDK64DRAFT_252565 [Phyllosticta capitalensis]